MPRIRSVRTPVKREFAERYILLSLVSFAGSVIVTRAFLAMTGYPQLGGGDLHIAHVLWGGLLLFIAALMPLVLANRWVFNASAILSGVGVGLFIDEVGKFITRTNDYFYPPAAPIIYAFFLLTVLFYLQIRKPPEHSPRSQMYRVLEEMTEVLDRDLEPRERALMETQLDWVAQSTNDPDLLDLVSALRRFLSGKHLVVTHHRPSRFERMSEQLFPLLGRWVTKQKMRYFLIVALGSIGVMSLIDFAQLVVNLPAPGPALEAFLQPLVSARQLHSAQEAIWYIIRTILEGLTGTILIIAGGFMAMRREHRAVQVGTITLIVWLSVINILAYYFDQFRAILTTLGQFFVLMVLLNYRRRFLKLP